MSGECDDCGEHAVDCRCHKKPRNADDLPELNQQAQVTIQVLMECFKTQLWAFAEYMNDSPLDSNGKKKVETWKYVDFILYAFKKELNEEFKDAKPWHRDEFED